MFRRLTFLPPLSLRKNSVALGYAISSLKPGTPRRRVRTNRQASSLASWRRSNGAYPPPLRCPLLAQSGHHSRADPCPLLGVKRTSGEGASMSAFDPKSTLLRLKPLLFAG